MDEGRRVSVRFHLFYVDQGNEDFVCKKVGSRFSCVVSRMEKFSLDLPQTVEKECALEKGCGGVWNSLPQANLR